ncbi:uncharacterized protein LOC143918131 [Arctopsyche grandis]|uniref:uncharacterized protein LOC143918131 n=1 Tax=Arctopsyche grandis TaxID=121162 RepID=UPI00406D92D9
MWLPYTWQQFINPWLFSSCIPQINNRRRIESRYPSELSIRAVLDCVTAREKGEAAFSCDIRPSSKIMLRVNNTEEREWTSFRARVRASSSNTDGRERSTCRVLGLSHVSTQRCSPRRSRGTSESADNDPPRAAQPPPWANTQQPTPTPTPNRHPIPSSLRQSGQCPIKRLFRPFLNASCSLNQSARNHRHFSAALMEVVNLRKYVTIL